MSTALPPSGAAVLRRTALAAVVMGVGWARAAPKGVLLRFSHVVAPDTPKGRMVVHFQSLVQQRSNGRIRVEVHPDSQLWGDDEEIEALRLGAVEMLAPSLSKFGLAGVPEFEVFDLPFLFDDLAQVRRVTQGRVGRDLLDRLARQQMLGLGYLDNGFKHMSAQRPLRRVADFAGLRVRVQASQVLSAQMRVLGARPVVLPFGETERALAQGVVEAAENPLSNFLTQGLVRWQPHVTLTRHGYLGYAVVSHPRFWGSLSGADQDLLSGALSDALVQGNQLAAELDRQALATLCGMPGVQVHEPTAAERAALRAATRPVFDATQRGLGPALLRAIQATT